MITTENRTQIAAEPGKQDFVITGEFDAPRELVFRAFIDPTLLTQWLGPRRLTMTTAISESRNGGMWRYTYKDQEGIEYAFHGVYHEVLAPADHPDL